MILIFVVLGILKLYGIDTTSIIASLGVFAAVIGLAFQDTLKNYTFNEQDYDLSIDAVKLNNYKLNIHKKDTVTYVQTINTVTYKQRSNKPQIGVFGGVGYDMRWKTFGPQIGIGVVLPLTKW